MWSSTALGDVTGDGVMDASAFTLGLLGWSLNAPNGAIHAGWPKASVVQGAVIEMSRKVAAGLPFDG